MTKLARLRILFILATAVLLDALATPAHALSCVGLSDRFFVHCAADNTCNVAFRARDVPTPIGCERRAVVESVAPDVASVFLNQLANQLSSGDYEITLTHRYYAKLPVTAEELKKAFAAHEFETPRVVVRQLAPNSSLGALQNDWRDRSNRALIELIATGGGELILLGAGLFGLYRTAIAYRMRLLSTPPGTIGGPLVLQLAIFVTAVLSVLWIGSPTWLVLLGLLAPVVMLVWVYELVLYLLARYHRAAARQP